jgi:hypothetical protein
LIEITAPRGNLASTGSSSAPAGPQSKAEIAPRRLGSFAPVEAALDELGASQLVRALRMEAHACERQPCGQTVRCTGKMDVSTAQQHETSAPAGTRGYTTLQYPAGVPPAEHGRRCPIDDNPVAIRLKAIEPEISCRRLAAR